MSGFSAEWLDRREAADHEARSETLSSLLGRHLARTCDVGSRHPLGVVDLGTGTGSNPRYLCPHLPAWQRWTLVDGDPALLAQLPVHMAAWATRKNLACVQKAGEVFVTGAEGALSLHPQRADLARFPIAALSTGPALVTASALLDLVSEAWLDGLVNACAQQGAAVLFALTYDGRAEITPPHPDDALVTALVNQHQRMDKGFGPALGPDAPARVGEMLRRAGYTVERASSDWRLGAGRARLQDELVAGWADAAVELSPGETDRIRNWERERRSRISAGALAVLVGHQDVAAWPQAIVSDDARHDGP